jgi:hypothetical protein
MHVVSSFCKHYTGKCRLGLFVVLFLQVGTDNLCVPAWAGTEVNTAEWKH